jgi:hypothetical protein
MGNLESVHFQASVDLKSYRWFKLPKAHVNMHQIEHQLVQRFNLDEQDKEETFSVYFLPKDGDWLPLAEAEDIESMFRLGHGNGSKKNPFSLQVRFVEK